MNNRENSIIGMFQRVKLVFAKFMKLFATVVPLDRAIQKFLTEEAKLEGYIQEQNAGYEATRTTKEELKALAVKLVMQLVKKSRPWAREVNNTDLVKLLAVAETDFNGEELVAAADLEKIVEAIKSHVADLKDYGVTDENLKKATEATAAFKNSIGTPQVQKEASVQAGVNLVASIKTISEILVNTDDLVEGNFAEEHPDETAAYIAARHIGRSVSRHTTLIVHVYSDAGKHNPLMGAIATIVELKRHDDTDVNGLAEIVKFKPATYHLLVQAKGFADKTVVFTIKNGQHLEVEVVLEG